jgi:hypothetical protein
MPNESRVRAWASDPRHPISEHYLRARTIAYMSLADQILDIADDARNDFIERRNEDGSVVRQVDHESIHRAKLRVDTRKWLLAKVLTKIYGDKPAVEDQQPNAVGAPAANPPPATGEDHLDHLASSIQRVTGTLKVRPPSQTTATSGNGYADDAQDDGPAASKGNGSRGGTPLKRAWTDRRQGCGDLLRLVRRQPGARGACASVHPASRCAAPVT